VEVRIGPLNQEKTVFTMMAFQNRAWRLGAALGWILTGLHLAMGQPVPRLDSASRTWLQRGTTNEIVLNGEALASAGEVYFSGMGLSGGVVAKPPGKVSLEGAAGGLTAAPVEPGKSTTLRLVIAADAPLGTREIRLASPGGVSNPLTLQISDLPEWTERTPDGSLAEAPTYELPGAISGVINSAAESDFLRFKLHAGHRVIFDVQANRTGSPLDPTLYLLDSSGKELARSEDVHGLDPFLEFTPPSDGDYIVKLTDTRFQGGSDYRYRLVAGVRPYLEFLFPFGGRRGTTAELQFQGHNLDGADRLKLQVASDAPLGRQDIRAHTADGISNPLPFEVGDLPEFFETEPNNSKDQANAVEAPAAINGRIGTASDADVFRVKSNADQRLMAEVEARPFGSPLDAFLTLSDASGNVIARNDDANGLDARIEFDAKKDTEYLLSLRDLTDRGGERFGYRVIVRAPDVRPDFAVRTSGGRFRLRRGGTTALRCDVDRRNGFDGAVRITGEGLPTGVTASFLTVGTGPNFGWIWLTASPDAPTGNFPLRLTSTGEVGGRAFVRPVQLPESGWLTILPQAMFTLHVGTPAVLIEQNGSASVDVSVTRADGFNGEVKVRSEGVDGLDIPEVVIPPGQSRSKLNLHAAYTAPLGVHPMVVRGEAMIDGNSVVEYAPVQVPVTTQGIAMFLTAMLPGSPFFRTDDVKLSAVALPTNSTSAANSTEFVVKVDRRGLTGEITLALEDLPKGVVASVLPIAANAREATVKLLVTDQAETGKELQFRIVGSATHDDRIWRQKTQNIHLFVAAPEKESSPTPAAAPQAAAPTNSTPVVAK